MGIGEIPRGNGSPCKKERNTSSLTKPGDIKVDDFGRARTMISRFINRAVNTVRRVTRAADWAGIVGVRGI